MKSTQQGIFILFLALAVTSTVAQAAAQAEANVSPAIQDLCLWQWGNRAHPDPQFCFLYVQCVVCVDNCFKKLLKLIKKI